MVKRDLAWEILNKDIGFTEVNLNFGKYVTTTCSCVLIVLVDFWVIHPDLLLLVFLFTGFGRNQLSMFYQR